MSLRARLLLAVLSVALAGLIVADGVTYALLNTFLTSRVDQQLLQNADPTAHFLTEGGQNRAPNGPPGGRQQPLPPGTYAAIVGPDGAVITEVGFGLTADQQAQRPALPAPLPRPTTSSPLMLNLGATDGGSPYRAVVERVEGTTSDYVLVAIPLTEVQSTLHRLLLLEVGVGLAVLLALAGVGAWAVRIGLKPLDRIATTAGEIAGGDLQRRVSPATPRTEVGRLGLALNTMLARIEEAFAARAASEDRLRRFVADASHELRTPVATIRGYAELFRRGAANRPDDLAMAMGRIEDEARRMGQLVEDMLLLARLDEGRPLQRDPVDLSQLAADATADARAVDPNRPITLSADGDVVVAGDEPRLRQVAANLVRNALIHTPPGTAIDISTSLEDGLAVLRVADHGPGIPPDAAAHIFERFFRADPAHGHDHGSTGLGLAIVNAVVVGHGGTVALSNTPGGGATFTVRLPGYLNAAEAGPSQLGDRKPIPVR